MFESCDVTRALSAVRREIQSQSKMSERKKLLPGDWKSLAGAPTSDVAGAAKRLPPWKPSEPTVSYPPTPDKPPSIEQTAQKILELLQQFQKGEVK